MLAHTCASALWLLPFAKDLQKVAFFQAMEANIHARIHTSLRATAAAAASAGGVAAGGAAEPPPGAERDGGGAPHALVLFAPEDDERLGWESFLGGELCDAAHVVKPTHLVSTLSRLPPELLERRYVKERQRSDSLQIEASMSVGLAGIAGSPVDAGGALDLDDDDADSPFKSGGGRARATSGAAARRQRANSGAGGGNSNNNGGAVLERANSSSRALRHALSSSSMGVDALYGGTLADQLELDLQARAVCFSRAFPAYADMITVGGQLKSVRVMLDLQLDLGGLAGGGGGGGGSDGAGRRAFSGAERPAGRGRGALTGEDRDTKAKDDAAVPTSSTAATAEDAEATAKRLAVAKLPRHNTTASTMIADTMSKPDEAQCDRDDSTCHQG